MRPLTFADLAETVTPVTIPDFFHRLRNRPEPHHIDYTVGILLAAAETLDLSLWELFQSYQETSGEVFPELTERVWQLSFPAFFNCLETKPEPKMATIIDFPVIPKAAKKVVSRSRSYIDLNGTRRWTKVKTRISLKKNVVQFIHKHTETGVIAK